jgi:hypothetical protein
MRYLSILSLLLVFPVVAIGGISLTPRPLDPVAAETFAHAVARSAVVRSLVARLEASNVLVHITSSRVMPGGIGGMTRFVTTRGGYRYLRITLGSDLTLAVRSAILGHELQHAVEIADSPAADADGMRDLFEREGHHSRGFFETDAAIEIERLVGRELRGELAPARIGPPARGGIPGK